MDSRNPVHHHYGMRSEEEYIGSSLQDLNAEGISDVDRDAVTEDSLDNDDQESNSVDCLHASYRNSLALASVGVDEQHDGLENKGASLRSNCSILTINDVIPIENARARFLQIFVDHFINEHVIEVSDSMNNEYGHDQDKLNKRKPREIQYEGDSSFVLPLMYVANLYETLVNDVNMRLAPLDGVRENNIGVALEAAGGLYRKLATKFQRKGPCSFKRRELATSLETRTRFPELVVQEEKRVRFVVVNGLSIEEQPNNMTVEDAEWFKRLTGRNEVFVSARDYKFYSPRHKYRRAVSPQVTNIPTPPGYTCGDGSAALAMASAFRPVNDTLNQQQSMPKHHMHSLPHQAQFSPLQQAHHQSTHQGENTTQFSNVQQCSHISHLSEVPDMHHSSTIPQNMTCMQSLSGGHIRGHLHLQSTTPAKYCDQCGTPYVRETSKYCSECGVKRVADPQCNSVWTAA